MKQNNSLFNCDWNSSYVLAERPDYNRFFQIIDNAGVTCARDIKKISEQSFIDAPIRTIVGETIQEAIAWLNRQNSENQQQIRIISDSPNSELLFLSSLLTEDTVILSDSSVSLWSTELPNPIHTMYWEGFLDQMILCRKPLLEGNLVLSPAIVHRTVGRSNDIEQEYIIDYSSSLSFPNGIFLRKDSKENLYQAPEELVRSAKYKSAELPSSVPIISLNLPVFRGVPVDTLKKLFDEDTDALMRLRFVLKEMNLLSNNQLITNSGIQEIAERLEYEISKVQLEYEKLIRKRNQSLANAGLGVLGLIISISFPENFAPIAATLGGAAAGVNSLKYVYSIKETNKEIRSRDYYFAWKAWKLTQ